MVILRRAPAPTVGELRLDPTQEAALGSRARVLRVLGAPGTGKSTLAVELVAAAVRSGVRADRCVVSHGVAGRRRPASPAGHCAARRHLERAARTHLAGLRLRGAARRGRLARGPVARLLNGPEQDVILRDLLAGHAAGDVPGPEWPGSVSEALGTRGFRNELRDLLMRAVEHGQGTEDLEALGAEHGRPEWVAAAQVLREYDEVTSLSRHGSYDPRGSSPRSPTGSRTSPGLSTGSTSESISSSSTTPRR